MVTASRREIRRAIAGGEAKPGERLPPAKDLAAVLGVLVLDCYGIALDQAHRDDDRGGWHQARARGR